jgi:hypothetical protein
MTERDSNGLVAVYQSICQLYFHRDQFVWSQIKTLQVVQASALTAAYVVSEPVLLKVGILLAAAVLTTALQLLLVKATWDRDANLPVKDALERLLIAEDLRRRADAPHGRYLMRLTVDPPARLSRLRGRNIQLLTFILFILIDCALAALTIYDPSSFSLSRQPEGPKPSL